MSKCLGLSSTGVYETNDPEETSINTSRKWGLEKIMCCLALTKHPNTLHKARLNTHFLWSRFFQVSIFYAHLELELLLCAGEDIWYFFFPSWQGSFFLSFRLMQHPPPSQDPPADLEELSLGCFGTEQTLLPLTPLSIATVSRTHMRQIRGQGSWVVLGRLNGALCVIILTSSNLSLQGSCQKKPESGSFSSKHLGLEFSLRQ